MSGISDKAFDAWHSTADKWNWNSGQYEQPEQVVPLSDALTLERQLTSQAATIERLRAALAGYADKGNWASRLAGGISMYRRVWVSKPTGDYQHGWSLAAAALGGSEGERRQR